MKKLLTYFLFLLSSLPVFSQSIDISKKITVNFKQTPIEVALKEIEQKADFKLSYNPKSLDLNQKVTLMAQDTSAEIILDKILGEGMNTKIKGQYVILQKTSPEKKDFYVMGYIVDTESGKSLTNVSVYEAQTLASTLSNTHGFYKIKLPKSQHNIGLQFSKNNYEAKVENIFGRRDQQLNINLSQTVRPKALTLNIEPIQKSEVHIDSIPKLAQKPVSLDSVKVTTKPTSKKLDFTEEINFIDDTYQQGKTQLLEWLMSTKQSLHAKNNIDSLFRPYQISLLPFLGTNHKLSPFVTNDYSLNLVAGYTGSVQKVEVGGVANLIRKNMTGVQIAGAANLVGRKMEGVQIAGALNLNLGNAYGFMAAGATNFILRNGSGMQIAGAANFHLGTLKGVQIAPFNYATRIKGTQIGVVNIAYEMQGTAIGVFSYVQKNGYRRLEAAVSELNATELTFKTGTKQFYNIFTGAYNYNQNNKPAVGLGYGLGIAWNYSERFSSNLDILAMTYLNNSWDERLGDQLRLSLGFEAKVTNRIAVFVAPTLNVYATNEGQLNFANYKFLISKDKLDWPKYNYNSTLYSWLGYKVGLRFCNKS